MWCDKNKVLKAICDVSCVLEEEHPIDSEELKDLLVSGIECYKLLRQVSRDVEQSSEYRLLFHAVHNLRMTLMNHCNFLLSVLRH
jgi:hypothetical protein